MVVSNIDKDGFKDKEGAFKAGIVFLSGNQAASDDVNVASVDKVTYTIASKLGISPLPVSCDASTRRLQQSGSSLQVVTNIMATTNVAAFDIYTSASNPKRQAQFTTLMALDGLVIEADSITVEAPEQPFTLFGLPLKTIGIIVGCVGGGLVLLGLLWWSIRRCYRSAGQEPVHPEGTDPTKNQHHRTSQDLEGAATDGAATDGQTNQQFSFHFNPLGGHR